MRPPAFWFTSPDRPDWRAQVLSPLAAIYAQATAKRVAKTGYRAGVPVICVGNLNVGGTGKTPTVIALLDRVQKRGITAHVVSRGYGGTMTGPVQVDARRHKASQVGDEPLLLSAFAPAWVAGDRAAGVRKAEAAGAQMVILDDGFQNPSVVRDLSMIVVDATQGFGNGRMIPAGPLREPVSIGLKRADCVLSIGDAPHQTAFDRIWGAQLTVPRLRGYLAPLETGMDWQGMTALAFAGIGNPARFFATLRGLGANLAGAQALDDHQPLSDTLMRRLSAEAQAFGAQLVTTEKDAVRLPPAFRTQVLTLPVRLQIEDRGMIDATLDQLIRA